MNSETVSNLVTTGVGSEAAPVEVDEPSSKRLRPATSDVWNFFKKLGSDKDGVERAECKGCKKVFKAGVYKIRESIKYLRKSESRMVKFKECFEDIEGLEYTTALCLDVPTREYCPSSDEWRRTEKIFLDPRFKLNTLVHCYNEIDPISAKDKVEHVKNKLYKLFEIYSMTAENSGRPFYGCPNYEYGIHCNFFYWTDGCEKPVYEIPISQEVLH
ncbi:Putative AC transposase [Arachis hypogaea]|nr:Putative AC transposase [Arachis hypogaea]